MAETEIGAAEYNYVHFNMKSEMPKFGAFPAALHVGERAPDCPLEDLDTGRTVRLSELWANDLVVVEFGSFT
jgi:hypothetical protein